MQYNVKLFTARTGWLITTAGRIGRKGQTHTGQRSRMRLSDHVSHSAIATISVPIFVFVELSIVLGAFEALVAVWAL